MPVFQFVEIFIFGNIFGAFLCWLMIKLFFHTKHRLQISQVEHENKTLEEKLEHLDKKLENSYIEINQKNDLITTHSSKLAATQEKITNLSSIEEKYTVQVNENTELKTFIAELKTKLATEQEQAKEKIALLNNAKQQLTTEFENLANKIFEEKSEKFTNQNKTNITNILNPLREQVTDFKKKVEDAYDKESKDRMSLFAEVVNLKQLNTQMREDAINLTNALKGQNKTQGNWGELILERVLEESGLQKGREYDIQQSLQSEEGKRYQPDVIVHLPEEKDIVIDAKVSLVSFERYANAETEEEKNIALKQYNQSLRAHVKGLSEKHYQDLTKLKSLDFVLLFIPIESAFLIALEEDRELYNEAFTKNIILVCPSTLLATLRTIQNIWRFEYQSQNFSEIAKQGGDLYDKLVGFVEELQRVGSQLEKAQDAYNKAFKRLSTGRGNILKRTQDLKELGLKTKKSLDLNLLSVDEKTPPREND